MNDNNICKFILQKSNENDLCILHYVFETHEQKFDKWITPANYRIHYALTGTAVLHTQRGDINLKKGDVFFTLISVPYGLESSRDFTYYYIGYTGTKAIQIMNKLSIDESNCVFHEFENEKNMWIDPSGFSSDALSMYSEGLLLCFFAKIADRRNILPATHFNDLVKEIKSYIDANLGNPLLSLESIASHFSYSKKYISRIFSQEFNITFSTYLRNIRVQNACSLMEKGFESIQDIAYLSGFTDALYFSKSFTSVMNVSPKKHLQEIKSQHKARRSMTDKPAR